MTSTLPLGYWNPSLELMSRDALRALQWRRLRFLLDYAWHRSPFYRAKMQRAGIGPPEITGLDGFSRSFPLTTRYELEEDQRANPPFGSRLAVERNEVFRAHSTSGSSGGDSIWALDTEQDWLWGASSWASSLYNFGIRPEDIVLMAFGYGRFIGFWGAHYGFDKLGCRVISSGSFNTKSRVHLLQESGATVLACTPSYALRLGYVAMEMGLDLKKDTRVKKLVCGGEPGATLAATLERLESLFGAAVGDFAGTTETAGIIAFTCSERSGALHLNEDRFLAEVLDRDTRRPVEYGEEGVLVVTPLIKQAMPLLRYATGDRVIPVEAGFCACGRSFNLLRGGILGRYDDLCKVRGILFSPQTMEQIVRTHVEVEEFLTTVEVVGGLDTVVLKLDPRGDVDPRRLERVASQVREQIKASIGFTPLVQTVPHGTLARFEGKARRLQDLRGRAAS